ncbi:MAG: hypothetical protein QOI56_15 [Actinomycetota bacterium]|nr:hypothetical protein [Actinomycetota bacterium]
MSDDAVAGATGSGAGGDRGAPRGGLRRTAEDDLWDEIAYLAYHLHWDLDTLLDLEHADRHRMVDAVAALNERAWDAVAEHA